MNKAVLAPIIGLVTILTTASRKSWGRKLLMQTPNLCMEPPGPSTVTLYRLCSFPCNKNKYSNLSTCTYLPLCSFLPTILQLVIVYEILLQWSHYKKPFILWMVIVHSERLLFGTNEVLFLRSTYFCNTCSWI